MNDKKQKIPAARLHTIRASNGEKIVVSLNRGKAIKAMCTECMGWECNPIECTDKYCPLYPWRGKILLSYRKQS